MATHTIAQRLHNGDALLLDGGTGSELQRRGADVLKGAEDRLKAWSATANLEYADVVRQVHSDYLRVGADIITSNNFWTTPTRLDSIGERQRLAHLCDRRDPQRRRGPQRHAPRGVRRRRYRRPQPPGSDVTYQPNLGRPSLGS